MPFRDVGETFTMILDTDELKKFVADNVERRCTAYKVPGDESSAVGARFVSVEYDVATLVENVWHEV